MKKRRSMEKILSNTLFFVLFTCGMAYAVPLEFVQDNGEGKKTLRTTVVPTFEQTLSDTFRGKSTSAPNAPFSIKSVTFKKTQDPLTLSEAQQQVTFAHLAHLAEFPCIGDLSTELSVVGGQQGRQGVFDLMLPEDLHIVFTVFVPDTAPDEAIRKATLLEGLCAALHHHELRTEDVDLFTGKGLNEFARQYQETPGKDIDIPNLFTCARVSFQASFCTSPVENTKKVNVRQKALSYYKAKGFLSPDREKIREDLVIDAGKRVALGIVPKKETSLEELKNRCQNESEYIRTFLKTEIETRIEALQRIQDIWAQHHEVKIDKINGSTVENFMNLHRMSKETFEKDWEARVDKVPTPEWKNICEVTDFFVDRKKELEAYLKVFDSVFNSQ